MIELLVITSLLCVSINNLLTGDGMAFQWLGEMLDSIIEQQWIKKPLFQCLPCMASFWGTIVFVAYNANNSDTTFIQYVTFIVCLSGVNRLVEKYIYEL